MVDPHWKHYPVLSSEYPKEQEIQVNDLFLYSYLHFSHPMAQGTHSSDKLLIEFVPLTTKANLSKH